MGATAKVFTTGNSQAVRLPKAFRVDVSEMWISRNEVTGEILLKPKDEDTRQRNIAQMLRLITEAAAASKTFVMPRALDLPRNPFDEVGEIDQTLGEPPITPKSKPKALNKKVASTAVKKR